MRLLCWLIRLLQWDGSQMRKGQFVFMGGTVFWMSMGLYLCKPMCDVEGLGLGGILGESQRNCVSRGDFG